MPVWNSTFEANPKGTDTPAEGDDRIRELKAATRERIEHEHTMNLGSGVVGEDGWHRAGSAKVYVGANAPTHRPNGSAVLDAQDDGRLWLSSVDFSLRAYRHAAGSTTSERWEIVSGSGGSGENYVKNNLTKPNIAGVFNDTTGTTTVSWDATATDLLNVGALKIVLTNAAVGRFVDIDLSPLNANNVGQQWSIKLSYKLATVADDLVSFFLFDGTTEVPTTLSSLPYAGGTMQTVSGAVYPTTTLSNVRLRARFKDSTACTLYLADLTVGPFNPFGGAAIGNWTSYTPNLQGFGDPTAVDFRYRRVGSNLEVKGKFVSGTSTGVEARLGLPSGMSTLSGVPTIETVGIYTQNGATAVSFYILNEATKSYVTVGFQGSGSGALSKQNGNVISTSGTIISVQFSVPIAQWTSNINLVQDFQEFASNSGVGDADNTTDFVYGVGGALVPNTLTAKRVRRVRFTRPIQPTDSMIIEVSKDGIQWDDVLASPTDGVNYVIVPFLQQGTTSFGIGRPNKISSTDINVEFGQYCNTSGATFGAAGMGWNGPYLQNVKWRVRKISNGNMAEFDTRKLDGSVNVTGNYTVGNEQTVNVEAATANITIPAGLPIGTRKTIRKLHATTTSSVDIVRSGSEVFTSASLTSVPIFGNGSFWIIEKVSTTRWDLVGGSDYVSDSNGHWCAKITGDIKQYGILAGSTNITRVVTFPKPFANTNYSAVCTGHDTGANFFTWNPPAAGKLVASIEGRWGNTPPTTNNTVSWSALGRWY
jgi:hypothetical protein